MCVIILELNVVHYLTSHLLQGTSGTALKNPGIIGIYWPDALFLNLACVYPSLFAGSTM